MKRKEERQPTQQPRPPRDMSETIQAFAGDFIRLGETPEERESHLNAACSAWNIACNLPEYRKRNLDQFVREYAESNPEADEEQLEAVRQNMDILIERKSQKFPDDLREIVGARVVGSGATERIEVASADEP